MKKFQMFYQNHGFTRWKNLFFFDFLKSMFSQFRGLVFYLKCHQTLFRRLFCLKHQIIAKFAFSKGVMVFVKNLKFIHRFFQAKQPKKKSLVTIQRENQPCQTIKTSNKESGKICIILQGLNHGFGQKLEISLSFLFRQIGREKVFGNNYLLQ